ncbi:MAG: amino acid adenylation domain-containing protein [bacterium]|nr:amino acid adenylation domain-containing protein [bacterium]
MKPLDVWLSQLRSDGVRLWEEDGRLRYHAPKGALSPETLGELRARKEDILTFLRDAGSSEEMTIAADPNRRRARLSYAQQRLWFLYQLFGEDPAYNVVAPFRMCGPLDVEALRLSLQDVAERHGVLKSRFGVEGDEPFQERIDDRRIPFVLIDRSHFGVDERGTNARELFESETRRAFRLTEEPLLRLLVIRLQTDEYLVLLTLHHIVADGWSLGVLFEEWSAHYCSRISGDPLNLPPLALQYADFAEWQRASAEETHRRSLQFWLDELSGVDPMLRLLVEKPLHEQRTNRGAAIPVCVETNDAVRLKNLCRKENASLFMGILAAFQILIREYSGRDDFLIGAQTSGRERKDLEPLIGFFVNTIALRSNPSPDLTFRVLLRAARQRVLSAFSHQDLPFDRLVEAIHPERDANRNPLLQIMLLWQNSRMQPLSLPGITLSPGPAIERVASKFDLTLEIGETERGIEGVIEFSSDLFDRDAIQRMARRLEILIHELAQEPDACIGSIPMVSEEERRWLMERAVEIVPEVESGLTAIRWFERIVETNPESLAVEFEDDSLTYRELNHCANQLAHRLIRMGVKLEEPVGVFLDPSIESIVGLLGVMKSGAAYFPMDLSSPPARLLSMMEDAGVHYIISDDLHAARLPECDIKIVSPGADDADVPCENPMRLIDESSLAYIIFTSGSTGRPKGVMIEHRALVNLIRGLQREIFGRYGESRRVALMASASFDASLQQIFGALLGGHTLLPVDRETRRDPFRLLTWLNFNQIEIMDCTPTLLGMMLSGEETTTPLALKHLLAGGEALPDALIKRFRTHELFRGARLSNVYGPTECCVDATCFHLDENTRIDSPVCPLGKGMPNIELYVLNESGDGTAPGLPGELCIGGAALGRGYINQPAMTAERFIPHPFRKNERIYRTGDRARWNPSGYLEFLGRFDDQVKIRGYRIQLAEVENALLALPMVNKCAVGVDDSLGGAAQIVAWLVTPPTTTVDELRTAAKDRLAEYMIPSRFVILDDLPLNASGKIDRKQLAALTAGREAPRIAEYLAPRTPEEKMLSEVWKSALRVESAGLRDNFFSLGGDSIKALQIAGRLRERGWKLEIRDLFQFPVLEELAPRLCAIQTGLFTSTAPNIAPLTPIQRRFVDEFSGNLNHFNQAILLAPAKDIDVETLHASLQAVYERHPMLHAIFNVEEGEWTQRIPEQAPPVLFERIDLRQAADVASELNRHVNRLQRAMNIHRGEVFRTAWFESDTSPRLFMAAHHLVVDAVSWRILLNDLQHAYQSIVANEDLHWGVGDGAYLRWASRLADYSKSEVLREVSFWKQVEVAAPCYIPAETETDSTAIAVPLNFSISADATDSLLRKAREIHNADAQDVLLTALLMALNDWKQNKNPSIMVETHGRESLFDDISTEQTIGWFTSLFPVSLDWMDADSAGRLLQIVKDSLRKTPYQGIGYGVLNYLTTPSFLEGFTFSRKSQIAFNYLGLMDAPAGVSMLIPTHEDAGVTVDPMAKPQFDLEILGWIEHGALGGRVLYSSACFTADSIARLSNAIQCNLKRLLEELQGKAEREFSTADFDYEGFSQSELEAFMDHLD